MTDLPQFPPYKATKLRSGYWRYRTEPWVMDVPKDKKSRKKAWNARSLEFRLPLLLDIKRMRVKITHSRKARPIGAHVIVINDLGNQSQPAVSAKTLDGEETHDTYLCRIVVIAKPHSAEKGEKVTS